MVNHKKIEIDRSRYFDRLFKDYPARSVTTQKQLFKWLFEQREVPDAPWFANARARPWADSFKALMLGNRIFAPRSFLYADYLHSTNRETDHGQYVPIALDLLNIINDVGLEVAEEYKLTKTPVEALRLYAILLMMESAPKLFDGLQHDGERRLIKSSARFQEKHNLRVRVNIPQSPAANTAIKIIEKYRRF